MKTQINNNFRGDGNRVTNVVVNKPSRGRRGHLQKHHFIPVERFDELAEYLRARVDRTILGKRNRGRGHSNYSTFDEYQFEQSAGAGTVREDG
jgi:hypothetical protein